MTTKKQIDRFLSDPDYLALVELEREQRLLFITDLSETRVSAFVAWLFKPYEGHGLGDAAFRTLLLNLWRANEDNELQMDVVAPRDLASTNFSDLLLETEYQVSAPVRPGRGPSIDVLAVSRQNGLIVSIENKFGGKLREKQLKTYREAIKKKFPDYRHLFVYLDWNAGNHPDDDEWIQLDYSWLIDLLEQHEAAGLLSERALHALRQVRDYLSDSDATSDTTGLKRDRLIESLLIKHENVIEEFRKLAATDRNARIEQAKGAMTDVLLVEFHQRETLWREVLERAHHVRLIAAVKAQFGLELEVDATAAGAFFRLKPWAQFEQDADGVWGARVWAWLGLAKNASYRVGSGVQFANVLPEKEQTLRTLALQLRSPAMKAPPRAASWVRLTTESSKGQDDASKFVVRELQRINTSLLSALG